MFLIYSLPRSGSAWLSVFLTHGASFCFHDPLAQCASVADLARLLAARQEPVCGLVDTGAYLFAHGLRRLQLREFALLRDVRDIDRSLLNNGIDFDVALQARRFEALTRHCRPIFYDRLHDLNYLQEVWRSVVGKEFDAQRAALLIGMNIQRDLKSLFASVCLERTQALQQDCRSTH